MWDSDHSLNLKRFLFEETGRRFMEELVYRQPEIKGTTIEETALSAREFKGYALCLEAIKELANQAPEQKSPSPRWVQT